MLLLKDNVYQDCLRFLEACEANGRDIPTVNDPLMQRSGGTGASAGVGTGDPSKMFVNFEARKLRESFLELYGL